MNEEYKPNSHKYKEGKTEALTDKKIQKVVQGKVKVRPKSGARKLAGAFISEDASNVGSYVFSDILIPAAKKAISDIVRDGIDMILYGESRGRRSSTNSSYVSYRDYSRRDDDRDRFRDSGRSRAGYDPDDIVLETRGEAEEVLSRMDELIDTYGVVSVADLYDLVGKRTEYTDNKYGWKNIRNAEPIHVRDGWLLRLPKTTVI